MIGKEEFQQKVSDLEQGWVNERKALEKQHTDSRARLANDLEQLKKKYNELELELKLKDGEHEKETTALKELLHEATEVKDYAQKQLRHLDASAVEEQRRHEEEFRQREQELEKQIEEKEQEIENLIKEHNESSEAKLHEIKQFYD